VASTSGSVCRKVMPATVPASLEATSAKTGVNASPEPSPTSTFGVSGDAWMKRSFAFLAATVESSP
jgi:hypothetical protein